MSLHKAHISVGGPHGKDTKIQIDGVPVEFTATRAVLTLDVKDVNHLEIEHIVSIDEVEVEGVVTFRAMIARTGQPFTGYVAGEGDSTKAALADLLAKLP